MKEKSLCDKGYVCKFAEVKSEEEEIKNRFLSRLRKKIEMFLADNFGLNFIMAEQKRFGC